MSDEIDYKNLRVAGSTDYKKLGWMVAMAHEEGVSPIELCAVGKDAVSVALRSVIEANASLSARGTMLLIHPFYSKVPDESGEEGDVLTVVRFRLIPRL